MRRREFIAGLGGTAVWPVVARAQQRTTIPRIGVLSPSRSEDSIPNRVILNGFMAGLRELGYVEGQNSQSSASFQTRMPIDFANSLLNW